MNETLARNSSAQELAEAYRYSDDPGVKALAMLVIQDGVACRDFEEERRAAEWDVEKAQDEAAEAEQLAVDLKDLLTECQEALEELSAESSADLIQRIKAHI